MKNSLFLAILILICSCKKEDYKDVVYPQSSTGSAFVLKNSFLDNFYSTGLKDTLIDYSNNDTTYFYQTYFDLNTDFSIIENFEFTKLANTPILEFIHDRNFGANGPTVPDSLKKIYDLKFKPNFNNPSPYTNLVVMDCERDANAMYFSSLGFFLEQYLAPPSTSSGRKIMVGFYNNNSNSIKIESNSTVIMPSFYERTVNAAKNPSELFDYTPANQLLNQIDLGINSLPNTPGDSLQLTILTYTLFDTNNIDLSLYNSIKNRLETKKIKLNIISLLPVDFAMPLVFGSGGFLHYDISYIHSKNDFISQPEEFEVLVSKGKFPSSTAVQNMELLINGKKKNDVNRYKINCVYSYPENVSNDSIKKILRKQYFYVKWNRNGMKIPFEFEFKPVIK